MKWIKILFCFFINILKEVAVYLFIVPLGIAYYFCCLKKRGQVKIILCNHIGDIIFTLAVLDPLKESNKKITLLLEKRWFFMLSAFEIKAEVKKISPFWRWIIFRSNKTEVGQRILYYNKEVKIVNTGDYFTLGYEAPSRIEGCTLVDCIHRIALGLDHTYEIQLKRKKTISEAELQQFVIHSGVIKGKTVILTPVAHSVSNLDLDFYERLAKRLKEYGYQVFTNLSSDKEKEIRGTKRLVCGLERIVEIAEYCGYLIGVRNGLMDLVSLSNCKIVALYPKNNPMYDFYNIQKNRKENNGKLWQYQLTGNTMQDVETIIRLYLKGELYVDIKTFENGKEGTI